MARCCGTARGSGRPPRRAPRPAPHAPDAVTRTRRRASPGRMRTLCTRLKRPSAPARTAPAAPARVMRPAHVEPVAHRPRPVLGAPADRHGERRAGARHDARVGAHALDAQPRRRTRRSARRRGRGAGGRSEGVDGGHAGDREDDQRDEQRHRVRRAQRGRALLVVLHLEAGRRRRARRPRPGALVPSSHAPRPLGARRARRRARRRRGPPPAPRPQGARRAGRSRRPPRAARAGRCWRGPA